MFSASQSAIIVTYVVLFYFRYHDSAPNLQELHLNYTHLMRVFTPHRIAHISLWVMSQWLRLQKNSQMEECRILSSRLCSSLSQSTDALCVILPVPVHWDQSIIRHGALYSECLFRLHAACCYASKCHSLLLRIPQGCWHGEYGSGLLCLFSKLYVEKCRAVRPYFRATITRCGVDEFMRSWSQ